MTSKQIRQTFIEFFQSKGHTVVPSSSVVVKDDPTLLFTNAGMNQFKDIFLGNVERPYKRATDSQKCLRVSGKHNDLEEVGQDTYHHTFFEMLGNWSFGDYFKAQAIEYAWQLLTEVYKIDKENLYVTYFEGDSKQNLPADTEALNYWQKYVTIDHIIPGNKHDNFWEMGEIGPCGACSEIHIDLRSEEQKKLIPGRDLVNKDDPQVIEIWNLVFMEFNRLASGELVALKHKNIDTGMGFERLCMVLQHKNSNYDTDVFQPLIQKIATLTNTSYGSKDKIDIALRVCADHLRAVSFAIADGLLPSNNKAGYVIRRILRRAIRYGYTFLDCKEPFLYKVVDTLCEQMSEQYPELIKNKNLITNAIEQEESAFLKTLALGIAKFDKYISDNKQKDIIDGAFAFELFDTYGFPIDLTCLMAKENGKQVDMDSFTDHLQEQKLRSKQAAKLSTQDWVELIPNFTNVQFVGYDNDSCQVNIVKYRQVRTKDQEFYQIVLDKTPFYAEMGGEIGDSGQLIDANTIHTIIDTKRENNLIIHICKTLPQNKTNLCAKIDISRRNNIERNHSATHLLHLALREILGSHVEQKGSYVDNKRLRFDFSHPNKLSSDQIRQVEQRVNQIIRNNFMANDMRDIPIDQAKQMGAMALFGEKYGNKVRVIQFGNSIELCGGCHVKSTGQIGMFKIISEQAVASGIRRIEALTGQEFETYMYRVIDMLDNIKSFFEASPNIINSIKKTIEENSSLRKQVGDFIIKTNNEIYKSIKLRGQKMNDIDYFEFQGEIPSDSLKDLAYRFRGEYKDFCFVGANISEGKVGLTIMLSDSLVSKGLDASKIIRQAAKYIKGGGGGQKHYATAGGKDRDSIQEAFDYIRQEIVSLGNK